MFRLHPLRDPSGTFKYNDIIYVLFDGLSRVFLDTERGTGTFVNVLSLNGLLIFRYSRHASPTRFLLSNVYSGSGRTVVSEGKQLVRDPITIRGKLSYCE